MLTFFNYTDYIGYNKTFRGLNDIHLKKFKTCFRFEFQQTCIFLLTFKISPNIYLLEWDCSSWFKKGEKKKVILLIRNQTSRQFKLC